jgi:hypothetical protein
MSSTVAVSGAYFRQVYSISIQQEIEYAVCTRIKLRLLMFDNVANSCRCSSAGTASVCVVLSHRYCVDTQ